MIGQDLLERGFPQDASSSTVVLVYERTSGPVTDNDLRYIEDVAANFYQFAQSHPELGVKKLDTHRLAGDRTAACQRAAERTGAGGADDHPA